MLKAHLALGLPHVLRSRDLIHRHQEHQPHHPETPVNPQSRNQSFLCQLQRPVVRETGKAGNYDQTGRPEDCRSVLARDERICVRGRCSFCQKVCQRYRQMCNQA